MSHAEVSLHPQLSASLAECNMANVDALLADLAREAEGRHEQVASLMGVTPEDVEAALGGALDLTLSDLQELALAIGAGIYYRVRPGHAQELDRFHSDDLWRGAAWLEHSDRPKAWEVPESVRRHAPQPLDA